VWLKLTLTCNQFQHTALQGENWSVKLSGMQIINGGQTCKTIQRTLSSGLIIEPKASALVRIYELPKSEENLVRNITSATCVPMTTGSGIWFCPQSSLVIVTSGIGAKKSTDISSATAAEAVLSIWRHRPHQAKFKTGEHFGNLYDTIFTADLNGAQVIAAVLLFRIAENKRKRPADEDAPDFIRYASCFAVMIMGDLLLADLKIQLAQLDHTQDSSEALRGVIQCAGVKLATLGRSLQTRQFGMLRKKAE
jgi:hypothetical protein